MTANRSKTELHLSGKHCPWRSSRYIAITTFGLATFLVVLAFSRWHSDRFVAVAQLTAVRSNPQNRWSDGLSLQQTLCRALPLEQTAAELCRDGIPGAKSLDVTRLRDQVALRMQSDSTPIFANFSLSFTSNKSRHLYRFMSIILATGSLVSDSRSVPFRKRSRLGKPPGT